MDRVPSASAPVRVLIVDDQPRFHEIARELIDATVGFECVGCATCGEQGVDDAHRLHPDLVLMDVRMPGIGGVEAARRIASSDTPPVVVLITADEPSLHAPIASHPRPSRRTSSAKYCYDASGTPTTPGDRSPGQSNSRNPFGALSARRAYHRLRVGDPVFVQTVHPQAGCCGTLATTGLVPKPSRGPTPGRPRTDTRIAAGTWGNPERLGHTRAMRSPVPGLEPGTHHLSLLGRRSAAQSDTRQPVQQRQRLVGHGADGEAPGCAGAISHPQCTGAGCGTEAADPGGSPLRRSRPAPAVRRACSDAERERASGDRVG